MIKEYFQIPNQCPSCKGETKIEGKFLICDNEDCEGAAIGSVMKWIVKTGIQKLGVGKKTIEALFDADLIRSPADLYRLKKEDVRRLERQGERSSEKLIEAIQSKSDIDLATFLGALNIKDFSTSMFERLIEHGYDSLDKILCLANNINSGSSLSELTEIDGLGEKKALAFVNGIDKKLSVINDLLSVIKVRDASKKKEEKKGEAINMSGTKLQGKSFCFTGAINRIDEETGKHITRDKMWSLVVENGGMVEEGVKKGLDYLVLADANSTSGKTQKAKKLGIILVQEDQFFKMIGM